MNVKAFAGNKYNRKEFARIMKKIGAALTNSELLFLAVYLRLDHQKLKGGAK